jgi:hypothetical protein
MNVPRIRQGAKCIFQTDRQAIAGVQEIAQEYMEYGYAGRLPVECPLCKKVNIERRQIAFTRRVVYACGTVVSSN